MAGGGERGGVRNKGGVAWLEYVLFGGGSMVDPWWICGGSLVDPPVFLVDPSFKVVKNFRFLYIVATQTPDRLLPL